MSHVVLLVDDEPRVLAGLQRALHKEPYEILCAGSAVEALSQLQKQSVDVVISDQDMPGTTGTLLLSSVRQLFPDVVRLLLTGKATRDVVLEAIKDSAVSHFFTKPCNHLELVRTLRQVLQQKDRLIETKTLLVIDPYHSTMIAQWASASPRIMRMPYAHDPSSISPAEEVTVADILRELQRRGAHEVLVVGTHSRTVIPATVQQIRDTTLHIDTPDAMFLRRRGERLFLLFTVPTQEHYILPAWLQEVYFGSLVLQCQPPHTDVASGT